MLLFLGEKNVGRNWAVFMAKFFVPNCRLLLWCAVIIQCRNGRSQFLL